MRVYYDLHIHSCLSPCGDNDNTPNNIVNMAALKGLNLIAVADHNSMRNVPACLRVGEEAGVAVVPAMELTTAEDIHMLCLFPDMRRAEPFASAVERRRMKVKNRVQSFGEQLVMNERDEVVGEEENLLITSSNIPLEEARQLVLGSGGAPVLCHIDKTANSAYYTLGDITPDMGFTALELSPRCREDFYASHSFLKDYVVLHDSDAHYLADISEPNYYLELPEASGEALVRFLLKD